MVVRYQLAYDDYREATVGGTSMLVGIVISWGITCAFLSLLIVLCLLGNPESADPFPAIDVAPTFLGRVRQLLLTSILGSALISLPLIALIVALFKKPALPWQSPRRTWWMRIKPILFGVAAGGLFTTMKSLDQPAFARALTLVPAAVFSFGVLVFSIANHLRLPWNQWLAQGNIRLPTTMEMSEFEGLTFRHAEGTLHYPWTAIKGYRETAGLLLLYLSPASVWIVPKRSFSSLTELALFKQQLAAQVSEGTFLPGGGGFAVTLVPGRSSSPPPLPPRTMALSALTAATMPPEALPAEAGTAERLATDAPRTAEDRETHRIA